MRGSTRSGKTVAIIQFILSEMMKHPGLEIVIGVETIKNAKGTIVKDLDEWIEHFNLTDDFRINRSDYTFIYKNKSNIRIVPCDKDSKWYGLKADIFWFNEATHIDYSFFEQAEMRLPDRTDYVNRIILDFNPTNPFSWVRDLESTEKAGGLEVYVSTYLDNPFLGLKQKKTIDDFKNTNYNKWLVFAKGEYGEVRGAILTNWGIVDEFPDCEKIWYGMDFGFSDDPISLIKFGIYNAEIYVEEIIYDRGLTNSDLSAMLNTLEFNKRDEIIADSASPDRIKELNNFGWNVKPVKKIKGSINIGIDILQRYKINIIRSSKNIQDEIINYIWIENKAKGSFTDKPVDDWNHTIDAIRYVALTKLLKKREGLGIKIR